MTSQKYCMVPISAMDTRATNSSGHCDQFPQLGVIYEWSLDGNTVLRGAFHALSRVTVPGTYFCKVLYGDKVLSSNCVAVKGRELQKRLAVCQFQG